MKIVAIAAGFVLATLITIGAAAEPSGAAERLPPAPLAVWSGK
ncbi:MAG TPA: hypothetical protein VNU97_07975 [Rhizomicrobium sp.]|jgi:hypothetical protein|nr:hypothetical protein [Rhizomicrobium sp.]